MLLSILYLYVNIYCSYICICPLWTYDTRVIYIYGIFPVSYIKQAPENRELPLTFQYFLGPKLMFRGSTISGNYPARQIERSCLNTFSSATKRCKRNDLPKSSPQGWGHKITKAPRLWQLGVPRMLAANACNMLAYNFIQRHMQSHPHVCPTRGIGLCFSLQSEWKTWTSEQIPRRLKLLQKSESLISVDSTIGLT